MPRLLVVSATRAEAAHLPTGVDLVVTGIGKTAAAVATATALAGRDTEDLLVLNVGTAGALRPGLTGLFAPSAVLNHDLSADLVRALGYDPQERLELDGGDGTVLATGDTFVTDAAVRDTLAERAHLVDMEGYAVAYACRCAGVPVRLVKHVSDPADGSALDWPEVVDRSARVLGEWVAGLA
ncbi:nucleosidase [Ornithinicoccus halotolerans]|uniref:nucleosidase n=1 Tax=Ornithinicoccus halotolerans TaxID=1748220 RepID=UPI001E4833D7|nr:nucleosidase [Ornithinicoccus halotolerans]